MTLDDSVDGQPPSRRRRRGVLAGALLSAVLTIVPVVAMADEPVPVTPGVQKQLVNEATAIEEAKSTTGAGIPNAHVDAGDSKLFVLDYTPNKSVSGVTDVVTYKTGGKEKSVVVAILPTPGQVTRPAEAEWPALTYGAAAQILFTALVVAVILESGLATIFNWRLFLAYFDARGTRTVVSVVLAWWFVWKFNLDFMAQLVRLLTGSASTSLAASKFISALVIAGGSSAVNNLMVTLGFRSVRTAEDVAPKPPPTKAWISVAVRRGNAHGAVDVLVTVDGAPGPQIVGMLLGRYHEGWLYRNFLRDPGRFPRSGGFAVDAGKACTVTVSGRGRNKDPLTTTWGPQVPAAGAIVDIVFDL